MKNLWPNHHIQLFHHAVGNTDEKQHLLHHKSKTTADHIAFSKIWFWSQIWLPVTVFYSKFEEMHKA